MAGMIEPKSPAAEFVVASSSRPTIMGITMTGTWARFSAKKFAEPRVVPLPRLRHAPPDL